MDISPKDSDKLAKILSMLSSGNENERSTAGAMASEFIKKRGLSWHDILGNMPTAQHSDKSYNHREQRTKKRWELMAERCSRHEKMLNNWEKEFVESILSKRHIYSTLTEKQKSVLVNLFAKLFGDRVDL